MTKILRVFALACVALLTHACILGDAPVARSHIPHVSRHLVARQPQTNAVVIKNVRVFEPLIGILSPPRDVAFENGRIVPLADCSSTPTVVDGTGRTLLPGLIESHSHPETAEHLQAFARNGVTTVMSLGCGTSETCGGLAGLGPGLPDLYFSGGVATVPGGQHAQTPGYPQNETVSETEQAAPWVQAQVDKGASFIKFITERAPSPTLNDATLAALAQAAKAQHLLSNCHAADYNGTRQALDAGVNIVHHSSTNVAYDDEILAKFKTAPLFNPLHLATRVSVPTLTLMRFIVKIIPGQTYEAAQASVKSLHDAGIPILVGTDSNIIAGPTFGPSFHDELANLVEIGLTPVEALRSATLLPARHWMLRDRGVIAPGLRADLLLVNGDPTKDISATKNIEQVWIAGVAIL